MRETNHSIDLSTLDDVPAEQIPAVLAQLAAAQAMLAARLLANSGNGAGETKPAGQHRLLTVAEAAERTGFSRDYLYTHCDDLGFAVRVGRSVRFSEAGLEKWIRARSGR